MEFLDQKSIHQKVFNERRSTCDADGMGFLDTRFIVLVFLTNKPTIPVRDARRGGMEHSLCFPFDAGR